MNEDGLQQVAMAGLEEKLARAEKDTLAFARIFMRTERGEFLSFADRKYLQQVVRDDRPQQCVVACAQSGKSVSYLAKVFHYLVFPEGRPSRTAIYTFPTVDDVVQFASARAKIMIASSAFMEQEMGELDNASVKQFRNKSTIYFRGTWTDRQAISIPADLLVHDELDRSKPDTLVVYGDRTAASDDPRRYLFSTPTVPGFGISREWEFTEQAEWMWACPACRREQCFAPMDKSIHWTEHLDPDLRQFVCAYCGSPISREVVNAGRWVPWAPDNKERAGYHITGPMKANANAGRMLDESEETPMLDLWVQGKIGVPEVAGDNSITADLIRFGDWPNLAGYTGDEILVAGLDQGKHLDLVVGNGRGRIVAVHRLRDWSEVARMMQALRISILVCDMYPETRPVQDLIGQFGGRVFMADYTLKVPPDDKTCFEKVKGEARVRIYRTGVLDWTAHRIIMGVAGGDVWPSLPHDLEKTLKDHLCAPKRTTETDTSGQPHGVWIETGPDHFRHAHAYYYIASCLGAGVTPLPAFYAGVPGQGGSGRARNMVTGQEDDITWKTAPTEPPEVVEGRADAGLKPNVREAYPALGTMDDEGDVYEVP